MIGIARPIKNGIDYFSHDTDASSDEKVEPLIMLYGAKGYAFYFYHLERIYRQANFELDVSDAETIQLFTRKMQVTEQEYTNMLKTSLKHGAFDREAYESRGVLTSNGVKKRAGIVLKKRESMRSVMPIVVTASETIQKPTKKRGKNAESKVKETTPETKKDQFKDTVFLTQRQYELLVNRFGEEQAMVMIEYLDNKKSANGYTYKSDYHALVGWVKEHFEKEAKKPNQSVDIYEEAKRRLGCWQTQQE